MSSCQKDLIDLGKQIRFVIEPSTRTAISIPDEQVDWLKRNDISLSKFVQDKIREAMEDS